VRSVVAKWPFALLSIVSGVVTLISHSRTAGIDAATQANVSQWPMNACWLLAFYLGKIVWPANLTSIYPPPNPYTLANPPVLAGVLGVVTMTVVLILLARRWRGPVVGWAFVVVAILPTLGLVKYSWVIASDKFAYWPALGLLMPIAAGVTARWMSPRVVEGGGRFYLVAASALLLASEARGVRETLPHWQDSMTLYRHMERLASDSPVVHSQLGVLYQRAGDREAALQHLQRALALEPSYGIAHYNLGILLGEQGHLDEALEHFRIAVQRLPNDADANYNLGTALRMSGHLVEAAAQFRRTLAIRPDYVGAIDQLGGVLVLQGRVKEGVAELRRAVALEPMVPGIRFRFGSALLLTEGATAEAAAEIREAIRLQPDWAPPYNTLAWLLATSPDSSVRRPAEAVKLAARAVELTRGKDAPILDTMAAAQAAAGDFAHAVANARAAIAMLAGTPGDTLIAAMDERLRLYHRGAPYVERPPSQHTSGGIRP
jgi:tetratricopeptide (TPR) repeat protein